MNEPNRALRNNLPREQKLKLLKLASLRHAARTGELWSGNEPKKIELTGPNGGSISVEVKSITHRVIDPVGNDITDAVLVQEPDEARDARTDGGVRTPREPSAATKPADAVRVRVI